MRVKIKTIREDSNLLGKEITVKGWIRTIRHQKNFSFIEINDGSTLSNLQAVVDQNVSGFESNKEQLTTGSAVTVTGLLVESIGAGQKVELSAKDLKLIGHCDPEMYPLQKKRHSFEFLRTVAHLRPRTNSLGAVARVRNVLAYAAHCFFQERGFLYIQTPIITLSDCEGGGKMFQVTTLDKKNPPRTEFGEIDHKQDFFGQEAYLTVSAQLNAEIYACALSDVYTFGPTFRAENSNTSRHLAEFWMIEPEIAFADLYDNMELAEDFLKFIFNEVIEKCPEEMQLFDQFISKGVLKRLQDVVEKPFQRVSYTDAVEILNKSSKPFEFPVKWGCDLQSEHERYLCENHFHSPVIVYDYPAQIKAFYMRDNDDGKTVAAMDVLVPDVGEIIGGSQREERLDILEAKMDRLEMDKKPYWWYLELRKFGSAPHVGFGAGFERLVLFATGMENIRDVIPFPRYPGHADF